jgi:mannose-1-phosphate guanylyltransferase
MNNHFIAIMAGGVGSRFWPASRLAKPKQFLDILGTGESLLQMTFRRASKIVPSENILVISNEMYAPRILGQLHELKNENLLLEPSRNNTAPCVAYTALHLKARNPSATFAMLPSDHVIRDEEVFADMLKKGLSYAEVNPAIVTIGIQPTRPDTGYGYIRFDASSTEDFLPVDRFVEKPDLIKAQSYLSDGNYLWNAGIFIWSANTILDAFGELSPDILDVLCSGGTIYGTEDEKGFIQKTYPKTRNISVDYAILEKASNVRTMRGSFGWSDLGTWNSLHDYLDKDADRNVILADHSSINDCKNTLVKAGNKKLIVVSGLEDFIIVDDEDVLLIYPKHREQEIKNIRQAFDSTDFV